LERRAADAEAFRAIEALQSLVILAVAQVVQRRAIGYSAQDEDD
jgi:hypothetical protein